MVPAAHSAHVPARCYNCAWLKYPLLGPLAALASGILVYRFIPFGPSESLGAIAGFFALGCLALWQGSRVLSGVCCLLGLFFAGALDSRVHAPGPPPQIDAGGREVVILSGCVTEPPAVSGERERFLLELDRDARTQVTLYTKPGETLPALHYGQNIELDAKVRPMWGVLSIRISMSMPDTSSRTMHSI